MAIIITKESGLAKRYITEGFIESRDDVQVLSTGLTPGSTFVCLADLSVWVLNTHRQWIEIGGEE